MGCEWTGHARLQFASTRTARRLASAWMATACKAASKVATWTTAALIHHARGHERLVRASLAAAKLAVRDCDSLA